MTWIGPRDTSLFGSKTLLSSLGDTSSIPDIIISAPMNTRFIKNTPGMVFVFSGETYDTIVTFVGNSNADAFGVDFDVADANSDGFTDIIIGAPTDSNGGSVQIFSGMSGDRILTIGGESPDGNFGFSLCALGDINADGYTEVLIGEPFGVTGLAGIYSGRDGSGLLQISGVSSFGRVTTALGDIDGDGNSDFLVSAPDEDPFGTSRGRVYVYSSRDSDRDGVFDCLDDCPKVFDPEQSDSDGDGLGDACDFRPTNPILTCCCDQPGNVNNSEPGGPGQSTVNIADVTFLIALIFAGGPVPPCADEADANSDNTVNVADITFLIARIFAGGAAPVCGTSGL